ncbi:a-factor receptor, partial [Serendipita sp. 399]
MRELAFTLGCALAILCLLLPFPSLIPLPLRSKSRNRHPPNPGTLLYFAWSLTGNLIYLVHSIVWNGNIRNPSPIWCDIATKLIIGLSVGLPCASLCIQRRLYLVSRVNPTNIHTEKVHARIPTLPPSTVSLFLSRGRATWKLIKLQRVQNLIFDLSIGLGIPTLVMTLHYVVQGHRYDILEDYGCWPTIYMTPLAIPLVLLWPLLISAVAIPYCVRSYISFYRHRANFHKYLAPATGSSNPTSPASPSPSPPSPISPASTTNARGRQQYLLTPDRYLRLMALSSLELLLVLPLNLVSFISNLRNIPMRPWVSWSYVHYNFSRVAYVSRFMMQRAPGGGKRYFVEFALARWAIPITGFLFFVFFGWSVEAKREYRSWWEGIKKAGWCLFRRPAAPAARAVDASDRNRKSGGSSSFASPMVDTTTTTTTNSIRTLSMQTPTTSSHLLDLNEGRKREKKRGGRGRGRGGWGADPLASITSTDLEDLVADAKSTTINDDDDDDVDLDLERNLVAEEAGEEVGVLALPPLSVPDAVYNPHSNVWSPSPLPFISSPTSSSSSSCESPTTTTAVGTVGKHSGGGGMFGGWDSNKPLPPTPLPSRPVSLATLVSVRSGKSGRRGAVRTRTRTRTPPPPVPSPGVVPTIVTVPATPTEQERRAEDDGDDEEEETGTGTGMETVYHTPAPSNVFLRPLSLSIASTSSWDASLGNLWSQQQHQQQQQQQQLQQRDEDRDKDGMHPHPRIATPIPPLLSLPLPAPIPGAPSTGGGGGGRSKGKGKGK